MRPARAAAIVDLPDQPDQGGTSFVDATTEEGNPPGAMAIAIARFRQSLRTKAAQSAKGAHEDDCSPGECVCNVREANANGFSVFYAGDPVARNRFGITG